MHSHSDWVLPQPDHADGAGAAARAGHHHHRRRQLRLLAGAVPRRQPRRCCRWSAACCTTATSTMAGAAWASYLAALETARARAQRRAAGRPRHGARRGEGHARRARRRPTRSRGWPTSCAPRSTRAPSACPPASATRPASSPTSTSCVGVTAPLRERRGVYTSHARSYIALDHRAAPDQPPTNLLALDETAAVWRAHGVKVQHSHLIFVGDRTWPTTDRVARALRSAARRGRRHRLRRLPLRRRQHHAGRLHAAVDARPSCARAVTDPEHAPAVRRHAQLGAAVARHALGGHADPVGAAARARALRGHDHRRRSRASAAPGSDRDLSRSRRRAGQPDAHHELELQRPRRRGGQPAQGARALAPAASRPTPSSPATASTTRRRTAPSRACSAATCASCGLLSLPEAVRRMTGFNAERMNLRDRGRIDAGSRRRSGGLRPGDRRRPTGTRRPTGIETVVLNGRVVVERRPLRPSRAGRRGAQVNEEGTQRSQRPRGDAEASALPCDLCVRSWM